MEILNNCDTLSVHNFYSVIQKKDFGYLVKGYEKNFVFKGLEMHLKDEEEIELIDVFDKISHELNCMNVTSQMIKDKKQDIQIKYDECCYDIIEKCLEVYEQTANFDIFTLLKHIDIFVDEEKNIEDQVNMLIRKVKGLKNKIRIAKVKVVARSKGKTNNSDILEKIRKKAVYLSLNLGLSKTIDIKKTSLTEWSTLNKVSDEKTKFANG